MFIRQGTGLQGQAVFRTKLSFRPHSTESFTHRKMTLSLADRSQKTSGIKILSQVGVDPDNDRAERLKVCNSSQISKRNNYYDFVDRKKKRSCDKLPNRKLRAKKVIRLYGHMPPAIPSGRKRVATMMLLFLLMLLRINIKEVRQMQQQQLKVIIIILPIFSDSNNFSKSC